ncbi:hypothetical protein HY772_05335 [Candidatus Woesearchaeota archaeon]|nr:hypothetical protein [Candidatus Woesearchaeota archaeon]
MAAPHLNRKSTLHTAAQQKKLPAGAPRERKQSALERTSSHVWDNWQVVLFNEQALAAIAELKSLLLGVFALVLVDIVLIFPTDLSSLVPKSLVQNFFVVYGLLLSVILAAYGIIRVLGSHAKFKKFFSSTLIVLFMSLLVITIPVALIAYAIFKALFASESALLLFFSIVPFYNYLVFGWSVETLAHLKGIRSIIAALSTLVLILAFNLALPYLLI